MINGLSSSFEQRLDEINAYILFLQEIEKKIQDGTPRLGGTGPTVTVQQINILYSSVYLQLYNLIEATITSCLDRVTNVAICSGAWKPNDLTDGLRREWIRVISKSHQDLNADNRLTSAVNLFEHLANGLQIDAFKVEKGGGGNWDDKTIEAVTERIGCKLSISGTVTRGVKQKFRDDKGPLSLVVKRRNDLAHGSLSFAECGANHTVSELRDLVKKIADYLTEVVGAFESFIESRKFLRPELRAGGEPSRLPP